MKPQPKKNRKNVGLELRRTHYNLGNDEWNYLSQYRHDYPPYPFEGQYSRNMDNVTLRRTHFKLGDYINPYTTTANEQSKCLLEQGFKPAMLDENVKNDLRRSHFVLGNALPDSQTIYKEEYYDKSAHAKPDAGVDFKNIERKLRATSYVLGNDVPDYISEHADRYKTPPLNGNVGGQTISTGKLQQSHYVFGNDKDPWITTQQENYVPKPMDVLRYSKDLTRTNFKLGDDEPTKTTVHQETYIKHPIAVNNMNKELAADLRKHHFNFGNEKFPDQLNTINHQDYTDPNVAGLNRGNGIDPKFLRNSHWSLDDGNIHNPNEHYNTTYNIDMCPKDRIPNDPIPNSTFKQSISVSGKGPGCYDTEHRSNFVPMKVKVDPKDVKLMNGIVKDIKSSHFSLGDDSKGEYGTTTGDAYKFDPDTARAARGMLAKDLIDDLRATHYKLGYLGMDNRTTHQDAYVPLNIGSKGVKDPNLQKSHIRFSCAKVSPFEGETIYQTDYIEKPLPKEEDYCY